MEYREMLENARKNIGPYCKACEVCNGKACGSRIPGPGAKGLGQSAVRNYEAWQKIFLNMDTIYENGPIETETELFGKRFVMPVFAGPVGAVNLHYGDAYTDLTYNQVLVDACFQYGVAAFTGDGVDQNVMISAAKAIKEAQGMGVPTIKPWAKEAVLEKLNLVKEAGAFAAAMDIDAAGLPFLKGCNPPAGSKSVKELGEIIKESGLPFIVKGIITAKGARKAAEAGAAAIVVSNHGGRVLDQCPATAEVLPEIAKELEGNGVKILVDGGIRSGLDVFKALALGADGVLMARPFVTAVYGGGAEGVKLCLDRIKSELADAMSMCGAKRISEIAREMVRLG